MPVTIAELMAPEGPVDAALLFPGEQAAALDRRLAGYIAKGAAIAAAITPPASTAERDDVTRAYVRWRVYDAVVDRMSLTPSSFTASDEGSVSFTGAQLASITRKRDDALDAYNALVSTLSAAVEETSAGAPTTSVPVRFRF